WCIGQNSFFNTPADNDTAYQECTNIVARYDASMCQNLREEIDSLLVFAGLFSGVLTAFITEAYKWLLEEPDDLAADYLRQLVALMSNSTIAAVQPTTTRPSVPDDTVSLINGLWFTSLFLSLTSALVGIVSKQWLREYLRETGRAQETNLAVRQVEYEGLTHWYVGVIVTTIPLFLQGALFLFLIGIVYLLWYIQPRIAAIITAFGLIIALFFVTTTVLPALQFICYRLGLIRLHFTSQVPYKSAQAWLFLRMSFFIINSVAWLWYTLTRTSTDDTKHRPLFEAPYRAYDEWPQWDIDWTQRRDESARWSKEPTSLGRCLGFIELNFEHSHLRGWIWNCLWSMRDNTINAKYILQCIRRDPKVKSDFPSGQDGLAQAVLPLLHPRIVPQAISELVSMSLLDSQSEVFIEHIIRVYNSVLVNRGSQAIPRIVYRTLRDTIYDMAAPCSKGTHASTSLCPDILRGSQHNESFFKTPLDLVFEIITYIGNSEVQADPVTHAEELSFDFCGEITDWLGRYPDPSRNWRDFMSRVLWSAGMAVVLAKRLSRFRPLDEIVKGDPRLPAVYSLFELVDAKAAVIPRATFPSWTQGGPDIDEFKRVKGLLDVVLGVSPGSIVDPPHGADICTPQPPTLRRQRMVSTTTSQLGSPHVRAFLYVLHTRLPDPIL
ncbi:hypothetical protein GGG16DRAFT_53342, partial [Schizophyllum commune]